VAAEHGASTIYHDLILPLAHGLADARHDIATALDWVRHTGFDVARIVYKAGDWLAWFGVHTIEDLLKLPGQVEGSLSGQWVTAHLDTGEDMFDTVGNWFDRFVS
jgi:hypothetical protein